MLSFFTKFFCECNIKFGLFLVSLLLTDGWKTRQDTHAHTYARAHACTRILLRLKKEDSDACYNTDEPWGHYAERTEPDAKDKYCTTLRRICLLLFGGGMGNLCLTGTDFQCHKMKNPGDWMVTMVTRHEFTGRRLDWEMVKTVSFIAVCFTAMW